MANALGEANTAAAVEGLVVMVQREQDPLVLPELFHAAAKVRATALRDAILARLETGGLGYYATQAAYEALGAQREAAPYDLLAAAARQPSFNGVVQAGALRGLAATRRKEAVDVLLRMRRGYGGASIYARPAAVAALGALGPNLEKRERERVIEALLDLLRDPAHQVALAAVHSLGAMSATEATTRWKSSPAPASCKRLPRSSG